MKLYTWWAKYMFWQNDHKFPFPNNPQPEPPTEIQPTLVLAHRGLSDIYPENTIPSFDKAIEEGAKGIEFDIQKTVDGVYVVMHDATVDRTTNGTGAVASLSLDYIRSLDAGSWKGTQFTGEKVPTLDEVLQRYKGQDVFLMLHHKAPSSEIIGVLKKVEDMGMMKQVFIFSSQSALNLVTDYNPNFFKLNDGTTNDMSVIVPRAIIRGWNAVSTGFNYLDDEQIKIAHENGILVQCSYLQNNYTTRTQNLIDRGVNFILGNNCAEMVEVLNENNITQLKPSDW